HSSLSLFTSSSITRELHSFPTRRSSDLSETMAPTHTNPMYRAKRQCLGLPTFGTDAAIIDPETLEAVPQGEVGEIIVHGPQVMIDRKSTRLNSSHVKISYAVFCLKKKNG